MGQVSCVKLHLGWVENYDATGNNSIDLSGLRSRPSENQLMRSLFPHSKDILRHCLCDAITIFMVARGESKCISVPQMPKFVAPIKGGESFCQILPKVCAKSFGSRIQAACAQPVFSSYSDKVLWKLEESVPVSPGNSCTGSGH